MPPVTNPNNIKIFDEAYERFKAQLPKHLKQKELDKWMTMDIHDVEATAKMIENELLNRKTHKCLAKITPFIDWLRKYSKVMEIFTQANGFVVLLWGPIEFLIRTVETLNSSFDKLLDLFRDIGETVAIYDEYFYLFTDNSDPRMRELLRELYSGILEVLMLALKHFSSPAQNKLFHGVDIRFEQRVQKVLNRLERHKQNLDNAITAKNWGKVHEEFETARKREAELIVQGFRQALRPNEFSTKLQAGVDALQQNPAGGNWLLDKLHEWRDPNSTSTDKVVVLTGIPGAGKSVLTSILVRKLLDDYDEQEDHQVLHAFLSYQKGCNNTCLDALRSMLFQAVERDAMIGDIITRTVKGRDLHETFYRDISKLRDALIDIARLGPTFFVIDGFDELDRMESKRLINEIRSIVDQVPRDDIRVFFSSRREPDFLANVRPFKYTEIAITEKDTQMDLGQYVRSPENVQFLVDRFDFTQDSAEYSLDRIARKARGMFLYAKLILDDLGVKNNRKEVQAAINSLPPGLEQAYDRAFERMKLRKRSVKRLLKLLLRTHRALRPSEIQQAIMMDHDTSEYSDEIALNEKGLKELCGCIVEYNADGKVQFVHFSAHEYLLKQDKQFGLGRELKDIDKTITKLCLRYLCMGTIGRNIEDGKFQALVERGEYAFLGYTYENWLEHLIEYKGADILHEVRNSTKLGHLLARFFVAHFSGFLEDQPLDVRRLNSDEILCLKASLKRNRERDSGAESVECSDLALIQSRCNKILKELSNQTIASNPQLPRLKLIYGGLYRCKYDTCGYFTQGFESQTTLEAHEQQHDRQFKCKVALCIHRFIGFGTQAELDVHVANQHPDPTGENQEAMDKYLSVDTQFEVSDDPEMLFRLAMDAIHFKDREEVSILLKKEDGTHIPIFRKQLLSSDQNVRSFPNNMWTLTGLVPQKPLEAAAQCDDPWFLVQFCENVRETVESRVAQETFDYLLYFAASQGLHENVRILLERFNANPETKQIIDNRGGFFSKEHLETTVVTPLLFAVYSRNEEVIKLLLRQAGGFSDMQRSILYTAVKTCNVPAAIRILELGLNVSNMFWWTSEGRQNATTDRGPPRFRLRMHSKLANSFFHHVDTAHTDDSKATLDFIIRECGPLAMRTWSVAHVIDSGKEKDIEMFLKHEGLRQSADPDVVEVLLKRKSKTSAGIALRLLKEGYDVYPVRRRLVLGMTEDVVLQQCNEEETLNREFEFRKHTGISLRHAVEATEAARTKRQNALGNPRQVGTPRLSNAVQPSRAAYGSKTPEGKGRGNRTNVDVADEIAIFPPEPLTYDFVKWWGTLIGDFFDVFSRYFAIAGAQGNRKG